MELRHLRYFVAVAGEENVSRAALKLHVSQPGISRQIRDLEDEIGFQLLERSAKSVRLTDAGKVFLAEAREVLSHADAAVKKARAVAQGDGGQIHVGYAPTPTVELLPCALHTFQNLAPGVRVTLHDLSSEEMLRGLNDGKLDLCLLVRLSAKSMRGLEFELLREYPTCVAMSADHPLAKLKHVSPKQLLNEPLLAYTRHDYPEYHAMLEELFQPLGARPRVVEEHDSAPGLIAATEIGRGLAIVPSCMGILAGGRIKLRPLHPAPPPLPVGAAYHPKKFPVAARKFLQAARGAKDQTTRTKSAVS